MEAEIFANTQLTHQYIKGTLLISAMLFTYIIVRETIQ